MSFPNKLEAMEMARERLAIEINEYKQKGKSITEPTPLLLLKLKQYQAVTIIVYAAIYLRKKDTHNQVADLCLRVSGKIKGA